MKLKFDTNSTFLEKPAGFLEKLNYSDLFTLFKNLIKFAAIGIQFGPKVIPIAKATNFIKFVENIQKSKKIISIEKAAGNQLFLKKIEKS